MKKKEKAKKFIKAFEEFLNDVDNKKLSPGELLDKEFFHIPKNNKL